MVKNSSKLPLVSVVLPVYNGEKFLKESIDSILNQTFKNFELIIIEDLSKDNSLNILKKYKDKRIKLIRNKKNKGSIDSFNIGLKNSKGKYIAICTQDDIFHPKRFEIEVNYLEKNKHIFLVGSSAIYIDEKGKEIRRFRKYEDYRLLKWRLKKSCGVIFPSIMFHNEKIYLDDLYEYHFFYRLLKDGKNLINLPNFLVKYRVHSNAESVFDREKQEKLRKKVVKKFNNLEDNFSLFEKFGFIFKLFWHYIRTFKEKKLHLK